MNSFACTSEKKRGSVLGWNLLCISGGGAAASLGRFLAVAPLGCLGTCSVYISGGGAAVVHGGGSAVYHIIAHLPL